MTYFPLPDGFHSMPELLAASDAAVALYARAASWSVCHLTDGQIPFAALPLLTSCHGVTHAVSHSAPGPVTHTPADELVTHGVWSRVEGGYQFMDWPTAATRDSIEGTRQANRQRQSKKRRSGRVSNESTVATAQGEPQEASPRESRRDSRCESRVSHSADLDSDLDLDLEKERRENAPRPDVDQLCGRMLDRLHGNGVQAKITRAWQDEARRLLDRDGRDLNQALRLVDWAANDPFWSANVHGIPKFRKQFDRLRMQAEQRQPTTNGHKPFRNPEDPERAYREPLL